ncbi:MAG: glycosyltransferase family 39 protein [Anaerolineae bacterium]|nr:glycosyltransferase family 39 protein [Anaerolineae bacterium]
MHLTSADRSPASSWTRWALILLIAVSFAIRLYDLGAKSLWSDEGLTLRRAEQPLSLVFRNLNLIPLDPNYYDGSDEEGNVFPTTDLHPPLYFLMMHFWIRVAGRSEFALRFPSVVAATLTLPLLYALARRLLNAEAGIWAALLGAFSPFYLWYAQEARMYTWIVVLSLASVYALLALLKGKPRRRDYVVYAAVTLALLYTHYSGFFLLAFEVIAYGVCRLRGRPWIALVIFVFLAVALVPLVPYVLQVLRMYLFALEYRPLHLILAEAWSAFSLGLRVPVIQPLWQTAPFLGVFIVGLVGLLLLRRREAWLFCLGYLLSPILFLYALSLVRPSYMNPRHLMVASPAWEFMMAQGLVTLRRRFKPGLVLGLGCVLVLRGWANYEIFTSHSLWKDDIRGAVRYIEERARPGDAIVLHHNVIRLTFDYYYDGPYPEIVIPRYDRAYDMPAFREQAQEEFAAWARQYDRIWFLYGPPPTYFPHDFLPDWADANLFKVDQQSFEAWWTYVSVAAYDDGPPLFDALPDGVEPMDVTWGALHLVGFRAPEVAAGENAWLEFYWRTEGDLPDEPFTLAVKLRDEAGNLWLDRTESVLPFYSQASWPAERIVMTEFRLPLPDDMPPVDFTVEAGPAGLGEAAAGRVSVVRPVARDPAPHPQARFKGSVELLSSELAGDKFHAGHPLVGSLSWRAVSAPAADYRLRVRLTDLLGREVAAGETAPSVAGFPTGDWLPGDRVAGRLALPLPADLEGGTYRVQIGLVDAEGTVVPVRRWYANSDWFTVGTVRVEAWPLVTELPADVEFLLKDVRLGEAICLRGYDLARDGDALKLTLYWQADAPPGANYHVFVHVGEPNAPPVAQADGVPVDWQRPTKTWRAGEVIVDTHAVPLAGVAPGLYNLIVGMYDPEGGGGRPTTIVNGEIIPDGYVFLREIEVKR